MNTKKIKRFSSLFLCTTVLSSTILSNGVTLADTYQDTTQRSTEDSTNKEPSIKNPLNSDLFSSTMSQSSSEKTEKNGTDTSSSTLESTRPNKRTSKSQTTTISSSEEKAVATTSTSSDNQTKKTNANKKLRTNVQSGTWGTSSVTLDENGVFIIKPGTLSSLAVLNDVPQSTIPGTDIQRDDIKTVSIQGKVILPPNSRYLFSFSYVENIYGLNDVDTSNVTDMSYLFADTKKIDSLDLSNFNTSKVTNMDWMFTGSAMRKINLTNFNTSNVTDMSHMFYSVNSLDSLDLSSFDTSNVKNMRGMFGFFDAKKPLDLKNFNTSKVTNMEMMFYGFSQHTLDVSSFDTSNVTDMSAMFNCPNLTNLDLKNFDTSNVTRMEAMFEYSQALKSLDLSTFNTSKVTKMDYMFNNCSSLTSINLTSFDTSNVTDMQNLFQGCSSLTSINLKNFSLKNLRNMSGLFEDCVGLSKITLNEEFGGPRFSDINLPEPQGENNGKTWQNVGNGTEAKPQSTHSWTSSQLASLYNGATDADTYVLRDKRKASPLTISYVDQDGKAVKGMDPISVTGFVGDPVDLAKYQTAIKGYSFTSADKEISELTDKDQSVTLTYQHLTAAPLIVNYVDQDGKAIKGMDPVKVTGFVGDPVDLTKYQTAIKGYSFTSADKEVSELTDKEQSVTLMYTKKEIPSSNSDTQENNSSTPKDKGLPNTGESSNLWMTFLGLGILGSTVFSILFKRKKY